MHFLDLLDMPSTLTDLGRLKSSEVLRGLEREQMLLFQGKKAWEDIAYSCIQQKKNVLNHIAIRLLSLMSLISTATINVRTNLVSGAI